MRMLSVAEFNEELLEWERTRIRRRLGILSGQLLQRQNRQFEGTTGTSQGNGQLGFVPAFRDGLNGRCERSRFADGRPAPLHLLEGLPEDWIGERGEDGRVLSARAGIVAGFLRGGRFFTREQAARAAAH